MAKGLIVILVSRAGGRLAYRLLGWNPYLPIFFRLTATVRCLRMRN